MPVPSEKKMRAAIAEIERGYGEMIEGWKRQ